MKNLIDEYTKEIICNYKNETYSVRDNGAVMRHSRENVRKRQQDNIWTFGKSDKRGYLTIAGVPVHRIIATAFLGEASSKNHVVDHINTNRKDNSLENLRWVTRLENIILNPITCKKLMVKTGKTIDYILQHIEILHNIDLETDLSWMKAVTKEESKNCYENLLLFAEKSGISKTGERGKIGEWIFQRQGNLYNYSKNKQQDYLKTSTKDNDVKSYPCCPTDDKEHSLEEYYNNLENGSVFLETHCSKYLVQEKALYNDSIIIRTKSSEEESVKPFAVSIVTLKNNQFSHNLYKTTFEEESAKKYFIEQQGKKWTGAPVFDDYC